MQPRSSAYDLVSCMGVLSTVVDDWAFRAIVRTLRTSLSPGGLLLLREALFGHIAHERGMALDWRAAGLVGAALIVQLLLLENGDHGRVSNQPLRTRSFKGRPA